MERQYKDSGIEWIGRIPKEWKIAKLKYIYKFQTGATPPTNNERFFNGDFKWASIADLKSKIIYETTKTLSEAGIKKCNMTITPKGSLMYSFKLSVGIVSFCGEDMYTNEAIASFLEDYGYLPYLYYMAPFAIIQNANFNIYGAPILNQELIKAATVIVPPLPEQQRIASYLNKKCGEIDALIALQEKMIAQLTEYKQAVITEAVTKGLDPNAKLVPSGIEWIGDVPEGWKVMPLKWILRNNLQYGANESGILYDESLPRYVRITDIHNNNLREDLQKQSLTEEQAQGYILENNDILFARSGGTVGKAFIFKSEYGRCAFAGYLIRAQIDEQCDAMFVYYYTQSSSYDEWKKQIFIQATIQNIGADRYALLDIPVPPLLEQHSIASYLDAKCSEIDTLITLKRQKIGSLNAYKKSVIYEAVTSKTIIE